MLRETQIPFHPDDVAFLLYAETVQRAAREICAFEAGKILPVLQIIRSVPENGKAAYVDLIGLHYNLPAERKKVFEIAKAFVKTQQNVVATLVIAVTLCAMEGVKEPQDAATFFLETAHGVYVSACPIYQETYAGAPFTFDLNPFVLADYSAPLIERFFPEERAAEIYAINRKNSPHTGGRFVQ